jgi:hypothetical protein
VSCGAKKNGGGAIRSAAGERNAESVFIYPASFFMRD